jgi:predicted outer membrane repeat protein
MPLVGKARRNLVIPRFLLSIGIIIQYVPTSGMEVHMIKIRIIPWIVIGLCSLVMLALSVTVPAAGIDLPQTPTPQPIISPLAQELAQKTGLEPSLVSEMLAGGIPAEEINQENAAEWPAHLALLAERQRQRSQAQPTGALDLSALEMSLPRYKTYSPSDEDLLWQQIEAAHALGDIQTQLTLAEQLPDPSTRQRLLDTLSEKATSSTTAPEAGEFIGINGSPCAYNSWADALAAAIDGNTLYVDQGTWVGRIGSITHKLTIIAAKNNCQEAATGGVTIDSDATSVTYGGVADIGPAADVTFRNLILTNGSADYGGILYTNSSNVTLDNTDLTFGSASNRGGCLRINSGTIILNNDSEITDCEATGTGSGGGVAMLGGKLYLYDSSRIGDYLQGNTSAASGGGVLMLGGDLYLYDTSRIRSNTATDFGGGVYSTGSAKIHMYDEADIGYIFSTANNSAVDGAGVYLDDYGDALIMEDNSTIQYNTANGFGGGVYLNQGSHLSMNSASILDNDAVSCGGGIYSNGAVTIAMDNGSTVSENEATDAGSIGGGIYAWSDGAYITVTNSSIMTNTASYFGGIRLFGTTNSTHLTLQSNSDLSYNNSTTGGGGAIGIYYGNVTVNDSTISYNTSSDNGGAIHLSFGTVNSVDSHIDHNEASQNGGGIYNLNGVVNITCQNDVGTVGHNNAVNGSGGGIYDGSGNTLSVEGLDSGACYINSNYARFSGGGAYIADDTILDTLGAVLFSANIAHDNGGAVFITAGSRAIFYDTDARNQVATMYNNRAQTGNGGAIYADGSSHVTMLGGRIGSSNGNIADMGNGGGVYVQDSTLTLINTKVLNNQAQLNGGGIAAYTSTVTINSRYNSTPSPRNMAPDARPATPCVPGDLAANSYCSMFSNNQVEGDGGGLYLYNSTSTVNHTAILTNTADIGGAVRIYFGSLELHNSLIAANEAINSLNPAIIHVYAGISPLDTAVLTATHNTIADNLGWGIYYASHTEGEFDNNIVWGNDERGVLTLFTDATCNDTQDSAFSGTGNISSDPLFIATPRGPYRLSFYSPAVNRCTDHGLPYDLDGVARPWGAAYDMGAFEAIMTFLPVLIR